jgi:Mitochondrial carrier protein
MTAQENKGGAQPKRPKYESFISGGIAGVAAKTAVAPLERVKLIYMVSKDKFTYTKGLSTLKQIYQEGGFLSLWRGNALTAFRIFFYSSVVNRELTAAIRSIRLAQIILQLQICLGYLPLGSDLRNNLQPDSLPSGAGED